MPSHDCAEHPRSTATLSRWLTPQEVSDLVSIHVDSLRRWRRIGGGPPYTRAGNRVRYRADLVEQWLEARMVNSAVEEAAGGAR